MHFRRGNHEIDMTNGPILPKVLLFALPLMLSSILQLLFNAADVIVVGNFDGKAALAAVGSTGALTNLIVNLFIGLSVGTNVIVARYIGAGAQKEASDAIHTSVAVSLISGVLLAVFGFFFAGTFLTWMDSPEEVLPLATLYMKIYFLGMPFNMLYNFGAAVLRSVGDTQRPLIFLTIAGIVNVVLNLVFVIVFHMSVAGVALATITSQAISAVLVLMCLLRSEGVTRVHLRKLRIVPERIVEIAKIGLPAGLQSMCFALSNVLIQATINSFGDVAVAGNSAGANIEGFIYAGMAAMHQAAVSFTSQNLGAQKYGRIRKVSRVTSLSAGVIGVVLGGFAMLFAEQLVGIYSNDPEVIAKGCLRLQVIGIPYFACGVMDVYSGMQRGLGKTLTPMIVSLMGACAFRIFWIYCVLPFNRTMEMLYFSYPVSWTITGIVQYVCYRYAMKKYPVSAGADAPQAA